MIVDWQVYYDAAKKCHDLADELRRADKPVHDAVKGECAGMAGDAPGCKQWGEAYDKAAQQTMQVCSSLANALTNYGSVLYAMGYNYGTANKSNPAPPRPSVSQVGEYRVAIPTSVADNGIGFTDHGGIKEFLDKLIAKVLSAFGKLPNGHAGKLEKAHTTWNTFANHATVTGAPARIATISALFDGMDDATNRQLIQGHFTTLKTSADTVATASQHMAAPVRDYHEATIALGNETSNAINTLELTIALTAIAGGALALFSLGTSAVAAAAAIDADILLTINAIQASYRASRMVKVIGLTSLAAGAVGVADAFHAVPTIDLDKAVTNLAAIIAMKALIDDDSGTGPANAANTPGTEEYQRRVEELAKDPAKNGAVSPQSRREAEVALQAEHDGLLQGPIQRAQPGPNGEDTGDFVDKDGNRVDVKSSPDARPSYRPGAGTPIPNPQTEQEFMDMVNKDLASGENVLVDPDGMSAARRALLEGLVAKNPHWQGKVIWGR
ncbi:hypothetical protein NDR87_19840 [Nocardia sp. CDC159]|uniref:Uncharacterized protein n=1 Tax=Nocardia pulmonis TaxID=2951408 RepID=A0A9X2ED51_9NOCA|nr:MULTISPECIES: hypothetical protein [Nocardia]MCM6776053.1 hypothetical protein [Nocardia pulmonis]MCM6788620.1 hypothetical protein [Nocardia sp. CDC159]